MQDLYFMWWLAYLNKEITVNFCVFMCFLGSCPIPPPIFPYLWHIDRERLTCIKFIHKYAVYLCYLKQLSFPCLLLAEANAKVFIETNIYDFFCKITALEKNQNPLLITMQCFRQTYMETPAMSKVAHWLELFLAISFATWCNVGHS